MKVLVTGGAGYIGSHTCVELIKNGHEIVVVDNFANSHPKAIERVKAIVGKDFPFIEINICDTEALDKVCADHKPDCVIHFAGLKAVAESVSIPLNYYENNIVSTINLLRAMEKHGIKHLIFSSSATVYRADNEMPLTEDSTRGCTNPYGWTKYMCEQIITDAVKARGNCSAVLLRYFNPIGAHESGTIGEDPSGVPNNLLPYLSQTAVGKHKELPVTGADYDTPDGTGIRDYIHVSDLATGHVAAIEYATKVEGAHPFNLGTGKGTSVLEMIHTFEKVNGVKVPYRITDRRPGDSGVSYADPAKAHELLNWKAVKTPEEAYADTWRWQTNNPNGYQD
ncbi:MAG: UDP-glucose 4-epimerase GalE [Defluviitaleaceae bacterium]|nr:UDP-glucose 4-epimerase GalE [Defluviitaleaceae bacterium]